MTEEFELTEYEAELQRAWENLYEPEFEPQHSRWSTLYLVRLPDKASTWARVRLSAQAWISVYDDGLCELHNWHWFGKKDPHRPYNLSDQNDSELYEAEKDVWAWLEEWELVELKPIGPEDKEYFATDKLLGKTTEE